ncbi:trypsin-like peptidase domain-containing protein [Gammaproteobacteria bacterium]|nr:trypsin-like peptidase domain-containing protein [Gammaproteobacteria bacterium]
MIKKSYFVISLWIVLGALSALIFSSFYGKTDIYIPIYHDISNVLERTSPSVVNIWTIKKWKAWQEQSNEFGFKRYRRVVKAGLFPNGSGVVIEKDLIVTNFHVISDALNQNQELIIENNIGETVQTEVIGYDLEADIAVLVIIDSIDLKPFKIRRNIDQVKVGESVIAIGNPQGLGQSFSRGIVSAINRTFKDKKGNLIQTDASINPGNSGGALIDDKGRLLGVVNVIRSTSGGNQGLNFAIPVDTVIEVFNSIIDK